MTSDLPESYDPKQPDLPTAAVDPTPPTGDGDGVSGTPGHFEDASTSDARDAGDADG